MKMTKEERDLTIALGNEIARNRKLTNILNRVCKEVWDWGNCGNEHYMFIADEFAKAIDKNMNWWDFQEGKENSRFEYS